MSDVNTAQYNLTLEDKVKLLKRKLLGNENLYQIHVDYPMFKTPYVLGQYVSIIMEEKNLLNMVLGHYNNILDTPTLGHKTESYWNTELDYVFIPATYDQLSETEKLQHDL